MANPNIVNVTTIYGQTNRYQPNTTSTFSILNNAASSGTVVKIESLTVANVTGSTATVTVSYYDAANVVTTSPVTGGTPYPIASTVSVPANASLVVIEKSNGLYLQENACISVTSGTANALSYVISYEVIS